MSPEPPPTGSTQEISKALADISERAQTLIRDEIDLAKLEVTAKVKTIGKGAGVGVAAGVFVFYAVGLILVGLSLLAWYLLPVDELAIFWGFFLVAGLLLVVAGLAGWFAARALQTKPTPDMAIEEAQRIKDTIEHPPPPIPDIPASAPSPAGPFGTPPPGAPAGGFGGLSVPPVGSTEEFGAVPAEAPPAPVIRPQLASIPEPPAVPDPAPEAEAAPPADDDVPPTPPADGAR